MRRLVLLSLVGVLSTAGAAGAAEEQPSPLGRFGYFIGASAGIPVSASGNVFEVGYGATLGVAFRLNERLKAQLDYLFSSYTVRADLLSGSGASLTGSQRLQWSTLDISYDLTRPSKVLGLRLLGGPGLYWRRVSIGEVSGIEFVSYCDPYIFLCFPTPTPAVTLLGDRSSTDFGFNVGLNVSASLGYPVWFFVEPRFHYIIGPVISTPSGSQRANGYYLPVVFGFHYF